MGVLASPTVLLNAVLSFVPDRSLPVSGPDSLAVVSPMYNEEAGAAKALTSLLTQSVPLDEIVVSINGGTDDTASEVTRTLREHGLEAGPVDPLPAFAATVQRWHAHDRQVRVVVVDHHEPMSKADSVNIAVLTKLVTARRVLVVDGDTVLAPGFVGAIRRNLYRLRTVRERTPDGRGWMTRAVLEDFALQSGSVRSQRPRGGVVATLVWLARTGEYAVSGVLRGGQTRRVGGRGAFARSRLFTVVGCGFVARRDTFPMPGDTRTEDHDFTLAVQNGDERVSVTSARALDERGFSVEVDGAHTTLSAHLGPDAEVTVRTGVSARFVDEAVMYTDDPRTAGGLVRQLERWNGGAVESAAKRLTTAAQRRRLRPNTAFAVVSALLENLIGLSLVVVVPAVLGLRLGFDWSDRLLVGLLAWLGFDLLGCTLLNLLGLARADRYPTGPGRGRLATSWPLRVLRALALALPLQALRLVNAVAYVAAASRLAPALVTARGRRAAAVQQRPAATLLRPNVTWDRPAAAVTPRVYARTAGTALALALVAVSVFGGTALVASSSVRQSRSAWRLTYAAPRVEKDAHALLPLAARRAEAGQYARGEALDADPADGALLHVMAGRDRQTGGKIRTLATPVAPPQAPLVIEPAGVGGAGRTADRSLSPFCAPTSVAGWDGSRRSVTGAGADGYTPLSPWGILVLARLAPLLSHLEEAASAYDLDPDLLLRVLLNESYLDPLAVGPTEDLGLAQVTSDALTLLRSLSLDADSRFYNPTLITGDFSVFDPAFSLCAGAAKLAWAVSEPGGASDEVAYARYINPIVGVVRGRVADTHHAAVAAMTALTPLTDLLGSTIAAYRTDRNSVTDAERDLLDVAADVASGAIDIQQAYVRTAALARRLQVLDLDLYDDVLRRLYGTGEDAPAEGSIGTAPGDYWPGAVASATGTILATLPDMVATTSSPLGP